MHDVVVVFVARVFVQLIFGLVPGNDRRPGSASRCRILDRKLIGNDVRFDAREPLREFEGLRIGFAKGTVRSEIGGLDDQRVAIPPAAGISEPLLEPWSQMRPSVQRDDRARYESFQRGSQRNRDFERFGRCCCRSSARYGGRSVLMMQRTGLDISSGPHGIPIANRCRGRRTRILSLLCFGRQRHERRNSSVWWVDDERRSFVLDDLQPPRVHPVLVIRAIDIGVRSSVAPVTIQIVRERFLKFCGFFVSQDILP